MFGIVVAIFGLFILLGNGAWGIASGICDLNDKIQERNKKLEYYDFWGNLRCGKTGEKVEKKFSPDGTERWLVNKKGDIVHREKNESYYSGMREIDEILIDRYIAIEKSKENKKYSLDHNQEIYMRYFPFRINRFISIYKFPCDINTDKVRWDLLKFTRVLERYDAERWVKLKNEFENLNCDEFGYFINHLPLINGQYTRLLNENDYDIIDYEPCDNFISRLCNLSDLSRKKYIEMQNCGKLFFFRNELNNAVKEGRDYEWKA